MDSLLKANNVRIYVPSILISPLITAMMLKINPEFVGKQCGKPGKRLKI